MTRRIPTPEGAVLRYFRLRKGVTKEELAQRAGVSKSTIEGWENGYAALDRERLVEVLAHLEIPPEAIDALLFADRLASSPLTAARGAGDRVIDQAVAAGGWAGAKAARAWLRLDFLRRQAPADRQWAEEQWSSMKEMSAEGQEGLAGVFLGVERSWALAERVSLASGVAAAHRADEALRLARLAVRLAEGTPDEESFRLRLLGFCEPFLANALRVGGDLTAAREAFARADRHWEQGAAGDPAGLLDGARRLDLKASLLMYDGQFEEVRSLLDEALSGARTDEARGRLLLKKATSLEVAGEYEDAVEALRQAEPHIDARSQSRLLFTHRFNCVVNYCHLDRYQDADPLLPRVEALAAGLGTELDGVRVLWLKGRTWAGLGHRGQALRALTRVRLYFHSAAIAYDFALVSLELAALHLEEGRLRLVRDLAAEMVWIFESQQVHEEARAALALFCQAAGEEEARAEWTRRLVKYLYRAQHNPRLRFEP